MWAGYLALIDQQLVENGDPTLGFIHPLIYAQNTKDEAGYVADFHDITTGSYVNFPAVAGFDLFTGWGSPHGGLIAALARPGIRSSPTSSTTAFLAVPRARDGSS